MERQAKLQGGAFALVLAVALFADGLMDLLGPLGFLLTAGPVMGLAGGLVWRSYQ